MIKQAIQALEAPPPSGCYSQAMRVGNLVYLSGQIPLDHAGQLVKGDLRAQISQVVKNLEAVAIAAGGELTAMVKLTVYLTDITTLSMVNEVMAAFFQKPYPARTSVAVAALPNNAPVEIEAVMMLAEC